MEKIIVENDAAVRKPEICGRGLAVHLCLKFTDRENDLHTNRTFPAGSRVRGWRQLTVQLHLARDREVANGGLTVERIAGAGFRQSELFGADLHSVFNDVEFPMLGLNGRQQKE